jgi:hypothetical protein
MRATCTIHLILVDLIMLIIFNGEYNDKVLHYENFSSLLLFPLLTHKYFPQQLVLKHPQFVLSLL